MFQVSITEVTERQIIGRGAWTVVDKRPFTDAELQEANNVFRTAYGASDNKAFVLKEVMGYAPSREVTEKVEREVLKQEVESLDLAAVIKAINKL